MTSKSKKPRAKKPDPWHVMMLGIHETLFGSGSTTPEIGELAPYALATKCDREIRRRAALCREGEKEDPGIGGHERTQETLDGMAQCLYTMRDRRSFDGTKADPGPIPFSIEGLADLVRELQHFERLMRERDKDMRMRLRLASRAPDNPFTPDTCKAA